MKNYISRPFHCDKSHAGKTHKVVWGTSSQLFYIHPIDLSIRSVRKRINEGIVPHIVSWRQKDGKIDLGVTCGIIGCGCDFNRKNGKLVIKEVKKYSFTIREWNALVKFKNTGLEI